MPQAPVIGSLPAPKLAVEMPNIKLPDPSPAASSVMVRDKPPKQNGVLTGAFRFTEYGPWRKFESSSYVSARKKFYGDGPLTCNTVRWWSAWCRTQKRNSPSLLQICFTRQMGPYCT
jgi:hypothetical protein